MTPRLWGWVALLLIAAAYEVWGLLDPAADDTLSELTAHAFHTTSRVGAVLFSCAWLLFAAWFLPHIARDHGKWRNPTHKEQ